MSRPKRLIGVVGVAGQWSTEALADAVEAATGFRLIIDLAQVDAQLDSGCLYYHDWKLSEFDALVVKKPGGEDSEQLLDRLQMLRMLERSGVRVFNPVPAMLDSLNRISLAMRLHNAGIPIPPTRVTGSLSGATAAVWDFESALFKPLYAGKSRETLLLDTHDGPAAMQSRIEAFRQRHPVMFIQQRLHLPGRDLGLVFVGGDYLGAYAREGRPGAWNTDILSGGHYVAHQADETLIELARRAQALFGLDFATVDMAETGAGPVVFKVSAFGGYHGALKGLGLRVGEVYIDYILRQLGS